MTFTTQGDAFMAAPLKETFTQDSYNRGGLITFVLAMGFSILFFIVLLLAHPGVDLKEALPETPTETPAAAPTTDTPAQ